MQEAADRSRPHPRSVSDTASNIRFFIKISAPSGAVEDTVNLAQRQFVLNDTAKPVPLNLIAFRFRARD
jgi:hypothetical protein